MDSDVSDLPSDVDLKLNPETRSKVEATQSTTTTPLSLKRVVHKPLKRKRSRILPPRSFLANLRRRGEVGWDSANGKGPGPYTFPAVLASPSDQCVLQRFLNNKWVPTKMDFLTPSHPPIPGVPKGLEFISLADHFYLQRCFAHDFPDCISTQLPPSVVNRYQIMCGDTKNRIYYALAKYPCCSGCLLGYTPFRIYIMDANLEILMKFEKSISCALFWCFGGYGTKISVTGSKKELYGTITQRFNLLRPYFDIYDADNKPIFFIKGPPIIPFSFSRLQFMKRFKLYRKKEGKPVKEAEVLGIFLESAYGVGNMNMRNCLRIGFPRDIPYQHKSIIMASLFLMFFTYYELGDEHPVGGWKQNLRPLFRINPFYATRITRPYGYTLGKINPYCTAVKFIIMVCIVLAVIYYSREFFTHVQLHKLN